MSISVTRLRDAIKAAADARFGNLGGAYETNRQGFAQDLAQSIFDELNTNAQDAWTAATLQNSWVDFGAPYAGASYTKDAEGWVHLRGLIASGTTGTIFALPSGYRPTTQLLIGTWGHNGSAIVPQRLTITTAGNVNQDPSGAVNSWLTLENIRFRVI